MTTTFTPMRNLPKNSKWGKQDVMVVFGELFQRGYVNGLVEEAERAGMKIIFSTVGRRDENNQLRPLTEAELAEKNGPLINIPLEAGFDLEPASSGRSPVDQLQGLKLSEWETAKLNWTEMKESRESGLKKFVVRTQAYMRELETQIPPNANVLFVHTMAGGVPRAKIVMPAMNRVFKGSGDRYASSQEFWQSDLGRFADQSFMEVTAITLRHLIELSGPIRARQEKSGANVSYVAYGYHGTDVLMGDKFTWQSYSPYLQGFAKIELENIAKEFFKSGVKISVFNAPEILTNSSSIFLGVEVSLYPLLGALNRYADKNPKVRELVSECIGLLKPEINLDHLMNFTRRYFQSDIIQRWSEFPQWPQHNGPEQMSLMREASSELIGMHRDSKNLMTSPLSEVVFRACGQIMFAESWHPEQPVWWLGHDMISAQTAART